MTEEKEIAKILSDRELKGEAWDKKARELGLKAGQLVPGTQSWVPWTKSDLNPNDTVTFVAQDVLGTQGGVIHGENGKRGFIIDLNGLTCAIHVHELNTINRFFYSRYEAMVNDTIKLEEFKRHGPRRSTPWDNDKWVFIPNAASFGMDIDGRYLRDPKWYEIDKDGFPVKINNFQKLISLYFEGDLDFTFTKLQIAELLWLLLKAKVKKFLRRK